MENKKLVTILVLTTTVILALIALFTAVKLYQLGQEPANPSTKPKAKVTKASAQVPLIAEGADTGVCEKVFELVSPSESPSPSPSESPSPSPSASVSVECWDTCSSSSNCPSSLLCQNISGTYRCVNPSCPTESDCVCTTTYSPSPNPSVAILTTLSSPSTPTIATQELPVAGSISPTLIFSIGGALLLLLGILL